MTNPVERLLHRFDLERGSSDDVTTTWHGEAGANALNMSNRLFGGLVVGQAVVAAGRTHADSMVHSIQQVFLRAGAADLPLEYRVDRLFTGRTYASVRVEVHQGEQLISHAQVGLTKGIKDGPDRQDPAPPQPDLDTTVNRGELRNRPNWEDQPVEMRVNPDDEADGTASLTMWMRAAGPMPDDQLLHQGVLAYATDRGLLSTAWRPHIGEGAFVGSTLDHSIWFHRLVDLSVWHTYSMHSPTLTGGRGLCVGAIHDDSGTHIATSTQQGTFRLTSPN